MKIELRHDALAQKIFEAASLEDKARAKATRMLRERFQHYQGDSAILLNEHELGILLPRLDKIALTDAEKTFIEKSRHANRSQQRRAKIRNAFIAGLCGSVIFLGWGFWWRSQALAEERQANAHLVKLYQLSEDVRHVRSAADVENVRTKAENIVQEQLTDNKTKQVLKKAGVLQESETHQHPNPQTGWKTTHLSGLVIAAETGTPLSNARIEVGGAVFFSDENGSFRFPLLVDAHAKDIKLEMAVSRKGYAPRKQQLDISKLPQDITVSLPTE